MTSTCLKKKKRKMQNNTKLSKLSMYSGIKLNYKKTTYLVTVCFQKIKSLIK